MVSKTSAKAAAERYADEYVGTDANMINASILVRDDTFRSLAIAREQLGYVGGMLPGVYDVDRVTRVGSVHRRVPAARGRD